MGLIMSIYIREYDAKLLIVFFLDVLAWYCFFLFFKIAFFIPVKAKATKLFQILNAYASISAALDSFKKVWM
jgi:hypothetical protein